MAVEQITNINTKLGSARKSSDPHNTGPLRPLRQVSSCLAGSHSYPLTQVLVSVEKAFSKVCRALDFPLVEGLVAEAVMDDEGVMGVHATLPHPLTHDILHSFLEDIVVNSTCSVYTGSFLEERAHSA